MKILINGASGYLGKNFIKKYQSEFIFKKFSLLKESIKNIELKDIDAVLHCAALVHQKIEHPYELYHDINVNYPLKLAKKAKKNGVKHFIFISTIAVYGEDVEKLCEYTNCNPITPYGKSKLEAEIELLKLNDDNFVVSVIRPPMIYGKDAPGNIASLVNLISKIPLLPFSSIKNKRSFISIQNLCNIINEVINQRKSGVFLASDNESISTTHLIKLISNNLDKNIYLIRIPFFELLLKLIKPNLYKRLYGSLEVDNSLTKEKLNLKNLITVEEGIKLMIKGGKK